MLNIVEDIIFSFTNNKSLYIGDELTLSEHMLQTAMLAKKNKCSDDLSEASKTSLKLQGGIMNDNEAKQFKQNKNYKNAIKLRRFDEAAKKQNIKIKDIKDYKELLISKII